MKKGYLWVVVFGLVLAGLFAFVQGNSYVAEIGFLTSQNVYTVNERIELTGYLYLTNFSSNGSRVTNHTAVANASLNLTILNKTSGQEISPSYIINTTSSGGLFYSRNDYYASGVLVNAPSSIGNYYLRLNYTDPNNNSWWTENEILVTNTSIDILEVTTNEVSYTPGETVTVYAEAIREVGGNRVFLANVTINGTIQNSSKATLQNFSCVTGAAGRCSTSITAPSTAGTYLIEINTYKGITWIVVGSFEPKILMKDELGESLRYVFAPGEDASVEVNVPTFSTSEVYTFVGAVRNNGGAIVESIPLTTLENNNSYTNKYTWTLDAISFPAGRYHVQINLTRTGGATVTTKTSFEVRSWVLSVEKADVSSGFDSEYNVFPNKTVRLEIYPKFRVNGSVISGINVTTAINVSILDSFNNIYSRANATWNRTCTVEGCYQFSVVVPNMTGDYLLSVVVTYDNDIISQFKTVHVINKTIYAQSTDFSGALKDLFGTNEYVYLSLSGKNETAGINLTNASVLRVTYMNGSEISYVEVGNPNLVNLSNSVSEWAWNVSSQMLKLDPGVVGGLYHVDIVADNNTAATSARFFVNPYDVCVAAKNTPGSVSTGYYYSYQFKVSDTIYFELKITQAQNPTGRATFANATNGSYGLETACVDYSATKQVVNNATITIEEVKNMNTGKIFAFNATSSSCQSDNAVGGYTCTITPNGTWDGGAYGVKLKVIGSDGVTTDLGYGGFEARAFYIYAYSSTWNNRPTSNISLTVNMYEAGSNWWSNVGGTGGLKGTVTLEKVEYMGRDGEWLWPPVDYDYNVSQVNSSVISSGSGTMTLPVNSTKNNAWASGSYRAILKGTGDDGTSDYGYAWFSIRNWETYGSPIECSGSSCTSIYNINSKENVSLYITINNAGEWGVSGSYLGGNVTISVKKIMDCRKWPCSDYNSSYYNASKITVNKSNGWYWGSNVNKNYTIYINNTQGSWNSGYWSIVLDVNGTETGSAWFNTIAFYAEANPSDTSGNYLYSIKNAAAKYFLVRSLKAQKSGYYYNSYVSTDYLNTTIDDLFLWTWDPQTYRSRELKYPEDVNVSIVGGGTVINGSKIVNVTYTNGSSWGTGYYHGQFVLKDTANQTATAWVGFQVQPFRVSISLNQTSVNDDDCVVGTVNVYEPDWGSSTYLNGSYNISSVSENVWSGMINTKVVYTNFTPSGYFVNRSGFSLCPNGGSWGTGSWGNYHYMSVNIVDISGNRESGWLTFRGVPFSVSWGSISGGTNVLKTNPITVPVNLSRASSGAAATGNLTKIYQWRYDTNFNGQEEYVFNVGSCWSNVSGSCNITGTKNVVIYPPTDGWKESYNYLQAKWKSTSGVAIEDYSSIWFNGQDIYSGYWSNYNVSNMWQYYFAENDNLTLTLNVRDQNQNSVAVNVTKVEYAESSTNCWSEYCKVYQNANFLIGSNLANNGSISQNAIITLVKGTANWTKGNIYIRATVRALNGTGASVVLSGGSVYVKDMVPPSITITAPVVGQNVTGSAFAMNWTTSENAQCYLSLVNFENFRSWYCTSSWYTINTSANYCSNSLFNGTKYYYEYVGKDYWYYYNGSAWGWSSSSTGMSTGGMTHNYLFNASNTINNQDYGLQIYCYDTDWNTGYGWGAIKVNRTG